MRVVLDSNVWIDWLVFNDEGVASLKAAHRNGTVEIVIDDACLGELAAVLAYPEFALDAERRLRLIADVREHAQRQQPRLDAPPATLPRCTDPDDQKFVELAHAASAEWLVTRDKALIKLNRRTQRLGICVGTPAQWAAALAVTA